MGRFSKQKWPAAGPVRSLLSYLDELHVAAGQPSLSEMGRAVALAPSTLSGFFTGARPISRGNLELLVEHLGGDVESAERLRRRAAATAGSQRPSSGWTAGCDDVPVGDATARLEIALFDGADNRLNRPLHLLGRESLLREIQSIVDRGEHVLLHGLGGVGKTAVAATVADLRVEAGQGPYLWLRPGGADEDATVDALLRTLDAKGTVQDAITRAGVRFVVVDDVWQPLTLLAVLRALPPGVPALVTSRLKLGLTNTVEVGELDPADALMLLSVHAGRCWPASADELCQELGYHPYALEIAGRHLRQYGTTPDELRAHLAGAPHELAMPGPLPDGARPGIRRLLDRTVAAIDDTDAHAALQAFGALFSGTATVELLAGYLGFDLARTRTAVNRLVDVSLARRVEGTPTFAIHDLTFSYARALGGEACIKAVTEFVATHARDHQLLAAEMDNVLGAATAARHSDPDAFLSIVETLATGGYLDDHGHTLRLLRHVDDAIELVHAEPPRRHLLVTKRANAHFDRGELTCALDAYTRALDLAPNPHRQIVITSIIGKVLAELGRHDLAALRFREANQLADTTGDDEGRLRALEQESVAAFRRQDYARVREVSSLGVALAGRLDRPVLEAVFLNNLGTAEFELGVCAAIELHGRAKAIAARLNNDHILALTNRTLGADYHAREDFDQAQVHFAEAVRLYRSLGQAEREARLRRLMVRFGYSVGVDFDEGQES